MPNTHAEIVTEVILVQRMKAPPPIDAVLKNTEAIRDSARRIEPQPSDLRGDEHRGQASTFERMVPNGCNPPGVEELATHSTA